MIEVKITRSAFKSSIARAWGYVEYVGGLPVSKSVKKLAADKRRRIEAGAQAYIVKTAFDQSNLLDTIDRLIG